MAGLLQTVDPSISQVIVYFFGLCQCKDGYSGGGYGPCVSEQVLLAHLAHPI